MPTDRYLCLTDAEAARMVKGELRAMVRPCKTKEFPEGTYNIFSWFAPEIPAHAKADEGLYCWCNRGLVFLEKSPFGAPGTTLHLKETWGRDGQGSVIYKATCAHPEFFAWRSPVTMPAWAIRHHVRVKSVRAMQAKDLTIEDLHYRLGFRSKLREHDACCDLREQMQKAYHIADPNQWIWYCETEAANAKM